MAARCRPRPGRDLLTVRDVAFRLNISVSTVWRWVRLGRLPPPCHFSTRLVRWRAEDLKACIAQRLVTER